MPDIEGVQIDQNEIDAVKVGLRNYIDAQVNIAERILFTDALILNLATSAVIASVNYRNSTKIV